MKALRITATTIACLTIVVAIMGYQNLAYVLLIVAQTATVLLSIKVVKALNQKRSPGALFIFI